MLLFGIAEELTPCSQRAPDICGRARARARECGLRDDDVEARVDGLLDVAQASGLHQISNQLSHDFIVGAEQSFGCDSKCG